ncbi:MFS transporter [Pelomonas sp. SE-A7]|uniref:MFS transporter n=1 Tax=Pelomonas sp. SE-A7 TaxID=3054953 RepID=UPI00259CC8B6|nr:MFS transporter [Pelomonas sp. SE-A7]MDM4766215.1 MFS transporter [Pelomonas sp. SE-A7]
MRLPNLLATSRGRLAAFFLLYVTEGIPLGFAATAVASQLRRQGVGPAEIGAFVASFYLPWAFKWAFGPFIDVFRSKMLGHRRGWILGTQIMMAATLLVLVMVPLPAGLGLFTAILLIHNSFGAMQDVAIDALACNTLKEDERGLANGLMFGGAAVGQAIGSSGVLFLASWVGFQPTFIFVAGCILAVTGFVVLPMKEALAEGADRAMGGLSGAIAEMKKFSVDAFRSFVGSRGALSGVFFALLPAGAMSLGLALQTNLAVELGMSDDEVGTLTGVTLILSAACMVLGGLVSDKLGRRPTLFVYTLGMSPPVLYLMWKLQQHGYVMPREVGGPANPELITALWIASVWYNAFQGLMYGTRAAIYMDVTNPKVAATQFTAYMAMQNLAISIAASWQGIAVEAWGYPTTLLVDAITGAMGLLLLPALKRSTVVSDALAVGRARKSAVVLGVCCLLWIPYWANHDLLGKAQPIVGTFFTLVFVASALFLLAGREVLGATAGVWRRAALWTAPLMLAMHARYHMDKMGGFRPVADVLIYAIPLLGGIVLLALATRSWQALDEMAAADGPQPAPQGAD